MKIHGEAERNVLDTEIDDFGDIQSVEFTSPIARFRFRRKPNAKVLSRLGYDRTGIAQLGTTYPDSYDREELIDFSRRPLFWFNNKAVIFIATVLIIAVDFFCYLTMFGLHGSENGSGKELILVAIGIAIAIDGLPIFFAHNLHRQDVARKKVLKGFNIACFTLIGIFLIAVFIFRLLNGTEQGVSDSWDTSGTDTIASPVANAAIQSFIYMLIPCATSLLCFILNYLSYDPISRKILRKRQEILFKQEDIHELKALIKEMENKMDYEDILTQKDDRMYQATDSMIDNISAHYKTYVRTELMKNLRSPADTTDLSK